MQLRNLKIGIRAACAFTLLGVLVLMMGLIALYETRQMDSATDEIRVTWMPAVVALSGISTDLGRARALTLRAALDDNSDDRKRNLQMLDSINIELSKGLKHYAGMVAATDDQNLFNAFMTAHQQYSDVQGRVLQGLTTGRMDDARQLIS
nr:methyl-accepting chemotaxis protein [Gammaproteobacteria bacterium]